MTVENNDIVICINKLEELITNSIIDESSIIIHLESNGACCRNSILISDFELCDEYIMLSGEHFEIHINLNENATINVTEDKEFYLDNVGSKLYISFK